MFSVGIFDFKNDAANILFYARKEERAYEAAAVWIWDNYPEYHLDDNAECVAHFSDNHPRYSIVIYPLTFIDDDL
jgi:hypothetical protein